MIPWGGREVRRVVEEARPAGLQLVFGDFLGRGVWQGWSQLPVARHLELRDALGDVRVQLLGGRMDTGSQHDVRLALLAQVRVGDGRDRALENRIVVGEGGLDLDRYDVPAAPADHLLLATLVMQE